MGNIPKYWLHSYFLTISLPGSMSTGTFPKDEAFLDTSDDESGNGGGGGGGNMVEVACRSL